VRLNIGEGYIELAKKTSESSKKNAYLLLQNAKGLYLDTGLGREDKRMRELDNLALEYLRDFNFIGEKVETPRKIYPKVAKDVPQHCFITNLTAQ
jgi:hypothetical protein